jgi:hypothetical protein
MKYRVAALVVLLGALAPPEAGAYGPRARPDATVTAPPPGAPSRAQVLRALPGGPPPGHVRIRYEDLGEQTGPVTFHPLVGPARLVEARFRCVVDSGRLKPAD